MEVFKRCRIPSTWPKECGKEVKKRLQARRGVEEGSECSNVVWFGEERQQAELE